MTAIVLAGAVAGIGVCLLILALQRPQTRGAGAPAALARLDQERNRIRERELAARVRSREVSEPGTGSAVRLEPAGRAIRHQLDLAGVRLPAALRSDLSLVGRSIETHIALTLSAAGVGAVIGLVLTSLARTTLFNLSSSAPLVAAVIGLLLSALLPTTEVNAQARVLRRDFRHVVGSFLDLVALNLSGGRGVPEALNAAASISDGWAMVRIRDSLEIARLQGVTPWMALGALGEEAGIVELRDLAAALELVADDGAKVRESLAARAASLRRRELADAEGRAQARSQSMLVAQMLLAIGFLIFLIYPAIVRVLSA
jgi:Flp pilus assembly protein TadB